LIIKEDGFDVEPELAELLGDGSELAAEAAATSCGSVEPAHFLAYLARRDGSILHTEFLKSRGVDPALFCEHLYAVALDEDRTPGMPIGVGAETMSAASLRMLDVFEQQADEATGTGEGMFLRVVLDHVPEGRGLLTAIAGSEEEFQHFTERLERRRSGSSRPAVELFDAETGVLRAEAFDGSGRRVLTVLREEVAALGYRKATALHLLYALVGINGGVLQSAIQFQGVDPLREVHSTLAIRLRRPAARRAEPLELNRDTLHKSVALAFERAVREAARYGALAGEAHIASATIGADNSVIADWLTARGLDVERLRDYLDHTDAADEEDTDERRTPIAEIGDRLREHILGQDHAIAQVLPWIKRLRFGFPRERGPAAVLLFLGPSGCGKTELAKELARAVYGSDEHLLMLEMGQFATKESSNLFTGAPPGYVGYGEGKLTNGLRDKPQSVVLFDEVEKAHEDVWPALLRFLDEGLIDDPAGPTRDGRGCLVVLTSNLGSETLAELTPVTSLGRPTDGRPDEATETAIRNEVLKYFKRPEIYNRVDEKIVFRTFEEPTYRRLVERQVDLETAKFAERGTRVKVMPDVYNWLTGCALACREEGARCVARLTNHHIVVPVIDMLTLDDGPSPEKVIISLRGNGTFVEKA
jgi:ATP-dependent Clp protease ATP-binding subunit ClpC